MVFPIVLLNSCYRAACKMKTATYAFFFKNPSPKSPPQPPQQQHQFPSINKFSPSHRGRNILVCDFEGVLLRTDSLFPFFMLVAFEGGSAIRAFLLLLTCPMVWVLGEEMGLKVMIFVTFCGLKVAEMESVGRSVLPKFYLENLDAEACEVAGSCGARMVITSAPRVMVEGFLKEYLRVERVVGTELNSVGEYFTGLVSPTSTSGMAAKHRALKDVFGEEQPDIGLATSSVRDHFFLSLCKEGYVVNKEGSSRSAMTREKYPKALVFHDGRLAFLPTPRASLSMFMWLPLALPLALFRLSIGILLPYKLALFLGTFSGVQITLQGHPPSASSPRVLYVCTHRTLLDPVFLSTSLAKPLTAVTYSLSKMSELIAPIRTVRLTRERAKDGETMRRLLTEGDLVVCPEGTTCREPYLLRFSSLFAELTDDIVPVAMDAGVTMFYGTTARGLKCLDPIFFLMNPRPRYHIRILEKLPRELTCAGGRSSHEVANYIQRKLADALGFECTNLTRKDKYMMLAGNEGIVQDHKTSSPKS